MDKKNLFNYAIIFLLIYLVLSYFMNPGNDQTDNTGDFNIQTTKADFGQNELVGVRIRNNTEFEAEIPNNCPGQPFEVMKKIGGQWQTINAQADIKCENIAPFIVKAQSENTINYDNWNHQLFGETGTYKIVADISVPTETSLSTRLETNEFEIKPQGFFGTIWQAGFYQPIYNALIFLTSVAPAHDLGFAIIILTLIIRTILLIPAHKSMKAQRRMQEIQPKLKKIQEKYKGNQELIAKETMQIWKEHKVNPFGSCLPLLIQLPFLIAIFYVINSGLSPNNTYLLYQPLANFSLASINTNFLGILELTKNNLIWLPLLVGGLQFLQMKLTMMRTDTKNSDNQKEKGTKQKSEMEIANSMMLYVMPIMIALFTASAPAGVGLYWSTSTLYGIAQQYVVNKQTENEKVKVRVKKSNKL